jgi:hypothetical protein
MVRSVQIEPLTEADVSSAVEFAVRVLRVKPGDLGEQFASDVTDDLRQMFVAKAGGQVVAYGRVIELAADEAGPGNSGWLLPQRRPGGSGVATPGYRQSVDAGPPALGLRPYRQSVLCDRGG